MADKELIRRLREREITKHGYFGYVRFNRDGPEAADRIEALIAEGSKCDALQDRLDAANKARAHVMGMAMKKQTRIEALEVKVAKLEGALRFYAWENEMRLPSEGPWGVGSTDFGKEARAALADGGKDE